MSNPTSYLLDRLSIAHESLTVSTGVAHELGRDGVLGIDVAERLRLITEEVARIYVAIPRKDRPSRVTGSLT